MSKYWVDITSWNHRHSASGKLSALLESPQIWLTLQLTLEILLDDWELMGHKRFCDIVAPASHNQTMPCG